MLDKLKKKKHSDLVLVFIVIAIFLGYFLSHAELAKGKEEAVQEAPKSQPERILNVVPLQSQSLVLSTSYVGYVTPINSVDVLPYINGFVEEIKVFGGQDVKKDDVLVIIKQDEYKAQFDLSKAQVQKAQAVFDNAKIYYDRLKAAGEKAISKTEFDNAKSSFLSSKAALAESRANLALAQVNYDYTLIKAPISGVVGDVSLSKGDYISPSSKPLFSIIQSSPIRVVFSMTDKEYLMQNFGSFAENKIKLRLADGRFFENFGQFKYTDNQINKDTNSIAVYADFENEKHQLIANAYVDVLVEKNYSKVVLINQNFVSLEADGNYVYVVNNHKLQKNKIEILATKDDNYVVANSFLSGDNIVVDKIGRMNPNEKFNINILREKR